MYDLIKAECDAQNISISSLCKEITGSVGNLPTWKKSNIKPAYLKKIAEKLNLSMDYIFSHYDNVSFDYKTALFSQPQRIVVLRSPATIKDDEYSKISKYMKCSLSFLFGMEIKYVPVIEEPQIKLNIDETTAIHDLIYTVLDFCAGGERLQLLQQMISIIVLHNTEIIDKKAKEKLLECKSLVKDKMNRLYDLYENGIPIGKKPKGYGLNFSEFMIIRETLGTNSIKLLFGTKGVQ